MEYSGTEGCGVDWTCRLLVPAVFVKDAAAELEAVALQRQLAERYTAKTQKVSSCDHGVFSRPSSQDWVCSVICQRILNTSFGQVHFALHKRRGYGHRHLVVNGGSAFISGHVTIARVDGRGLCLPRPLPYDVTRRLATNDNKAAAVAAAARSLLSQHGVVSPHGRGFKRYRHSRRQPSEWRSRFG